MKAVGVCNVKGGTGKTLIAINLAYQLSKHGKTGLIDCDIDNSNFSFFTKASGQIGVEHTNALKPYSWNGIQVFSMSLIAGSRGISMSGDRYVQILSDALKTSLWDVEYFVLDLPAGASDIFRGSMHLFGHSLVGNIIVAQPSTVEATEKVLQLHKYFGIPVLGIIENMAYLQLNTEKYFIFGKPSGKTLADKYGVEYLGEIPILIDLYSNIEKGNPIINEQYNKPILKAVDLVLSSKVKPPTFLEKLKTTITKEIADSLAKTIASIIILGNKELNIKELREKTGFTEKRPVLLTITDDSGQKVILRACLRVDETGIKLIKNPKKIDFEIVTPYRSLARIILGHDDKGNKYDAWDAWLLGDIKVYGEGQLPKAIALMRRVFGNPEIMSEIKEKYGKILSRWI